MVLQKCKSCGGTLEREGKYLVCDHCHSKWIIDVADDIHAVKRANAWESLRISDFEKAIELFEEIVLKDKDDYEALWGLALAKYSIVYVNDVREGRKVPTCNNITEESFLGDKNVKTAISLAPREIADDYSRQAEYIDKVRVEWLKKASNEPPYDVFISFKDSDRERGIERTSDSVTAQDLYQMLSDEGYRVFYSRVSLRGKVAEQYEPYIYNAIKTAKVMIVYGEKAEYFSAPWIKNEWSRFKKRIEKGEKHKNSLVTLFKGVNPYDIPTALTGGKQAIDYSNPVNVPTLLNHVKMIVEEAKRGKQLDKVEIKGGKIGKKSSEIKNATLETREVGQGRRASFSVNDKQLLSLADTFISAEEWESARNALNQVLLSNPNLVEARWGLLKVKYKAMDDWALANQMGSFGKDDLAVVESVLNEIDKAHATEILNAFYSGCERLSTTKTTKVIKLLLPFKSSGRKGWLSRMFAIAIHNDDYSLFNLLLGGLESNEIDAYIDQNVRFARTTSSTENKKACLENVLSVEEGNVKALDMLWQLHLEERKIERASEKFRELLQYSSNVDGTVEQTLADFANRILIEEHVDFALEIVKYYQSDAKRLSESLVKIAKTAQSKRFFEKARDTYDFVLSIDENCAGAYWGICLLKAGVKDESDLVNSPTIIKNEPEYIKYLALVSPTRRSECIQLVKRQEARLAENARKEEENRRRERERRQQEKERRAQEASDRLKGTLSVLALIALPLIAGALFTGFMCGFEYMFVNFVYFLQVSGVMSVCFYGLEYVIYQTYFSDEWEFNGWSKFLFILSSIALAFLGLAVSSIFGAEEIGIIIAIVWIIVSIIVVCKSEYKETPQFVVVILNAVLPTVVSLIISLVFESGIIVLPDYFYEIIGYVVLGLLVLAGGAWYIIYQTFFSDDYDFSIGQKVLYAFFGVLFGVAGIGLTALFGLEDLLFDTELPMILCIIYTLFVWYRLYMTDEKNIPTMILIFACILVPLVSVWAGTWILDSCM